MHNCVKSVNPRKLEQSIKVTICKLAKIFPPGCRELQNLKEMVKIRYHVEGSICEAYIIKEISTFSSHYSQRNVKLD